MLVQFSQNKYQIVCNWKQSKIEYRSIMNSKTYFTGPKSTLDFPPLNIGQSLSFGDKIGNKYCPLLLKLFKGKV